MPMPKVENFCGGVQVTIERTKFVQMTNVGDNVGGDVGGQKVAKLAERQRKMLDLIKENPRMSANEMSVVLSVVHRTIQRDLATMQKLGVLIREATQVLDIGSLFKSSLLVLQILLSNTSCEHQRRIRKISLCSWDV